MGNIVGIDLGTTFSAIAQLDENGRPVIVTNTESTEGGNITPSVVSFTGKNSYEVGRNAKKMLGVDENTFSKFKRDMGTTKEFKTSFGVTHTPLTLSALVLKYIKEFSEKQIGKFSNLVVTVPANFSSEARDATMKAAEKADLKIQNIIDEPKAAAIYFGSTSGLSDKGKYVIYDLGGGTFDVSVVEFNNSEITVLSTAGVARLGGYDFDLALQKLVADKYEKETGEKLAIEKDDKGNPPDFTINDAEEMKIVLSKRESIKEAIRGEGGRASIEITRKEFEEVISTLLSQAELACEECLDSKNIKTDDIDEVILVGGSTRVPIIKESVKKVFGKEAKELGNPDEAVALGAALYSAFKADSTMLSTMQKKTVEKIDKIEDVSSVYLGTISLDENQRNVNSILIKKNQKIPCEITKSFYTASQNQTAVQCTVTESGVDEEDPDFVKKVWEGTLEGLPSGRDPGKEVKVSFSYGDNKIIKVKFKDVESGKELKADVELNVDDKQSDNVDLDDFTID